MNLERIYDNIHDHRYLNERCSLPILVNRKNLIFWFNYRYDIEKGICFMTKSYACNYDGEDMHEIEIMNVSADLNALESFKDEDFMDDEEYWDKFFNTKDVYQQLDLIRKTDEIFYIGLYEKIIPVIEK